MSQYSYCTCLECKEKAKRPLLNWIENYGALANTDFDPRFWVFEENLKRNERLLKMERDNG